MDDFLDAGEPLFVSSSNVAMLQYFPADEKLMVEYNDGRAWMYSPVSRAVAEAIASSESKGAACWDHLRVRGEGNKHAHQVNAVQIR